MAEIQPLVRLSHSHIILKSHVWNRQQLLTLVDSHQVRGNTSRPRAKTFLKSSTSSSCRMPPTPWESYARKRSVHKTITQYIVWCAISIHKLKTRRHSHSIIMCPLCAGMKLQVGEPPLLLSISIILALRAALAEYKKTTSRFAAVGADNFIQISAPATVEKVQLAANVDFASQKIN